MTKKEDPRSIRTQEMLKNAALTLLNEGVLISQLSVQKVTHRALLNRTTFYLHYRDIDDLVSQLMQDVLHELTNQIEGLIQLKDNNKQIQLVQLLDYLYTQRHHLLILFQLEQFEKHLFSLIKKLIEKRRMNTSIIPTEFYVDIDIRTASLVGIIMWWLKNGLHLSSDYIADQINLMYKS
ncbi:TetR/AcrR family transcriptional regulator [Sporosarcina aquimarina]|uniref:TetR/AcrR family transcriptional regulator n=1 Tax=Sporosarcina aquimarina TaxID=114975 RepID=UPI00203B55C1|nr:TetR/AcrR family transcriptional regulator [Sporosarcina aquimarina]MCM3758020.1 TetR/AcrR family transcriptional regulator [Sporosarcina aquimarina]